MAAGLQHRAILMGQSELFPEEVGILPARSTTRFLPIVEQRTSAAPVRLAQFSRSTHLIARRAPGDSLA